MNLLGFPRSQVTVYLLEGRCSLPRGHIENGHHPAGMRAFQSIDPLSPNLSSLYTLALPEGQVQLRQRYTENVAVTGWILSEVPEPHCPSVRGCKQSTSTAGTIFCKQVQLKAPRWQLFGSEDGSVEHARCGLEAGRQRCTLTLSSCVL